MDMKTMLMKILRKFGYWELDDFCAQIDERRGEASFRSYGHWELPIEAYIDDDYEDYDWKTLSEKTCKDVDQKCKELEKELGVKLTWSVEEKEWISVSIVK